ncbi:MAG: regulatory iron-sulfur-containing complex subunit RicT [Endomicrobiia bacterium]
MHQKLIVEVKLENKEVIYAENVNGIDIKISDKVIVYFDNTYEIAEVLSDEKLVDEISLRKENVAKIIRKLNEHDFQRIKENQNRAREAYKIIKKTCSNYELPIKISFVEYSFDRTKLYVYYIQEKPTNLGKIIQEFAHKFKAKIIMKQIGPRDETKMLGGIGVCGYELCCKRWIKNFESISVEMAKIQQLSLNIPKLSGLCNRLKCCLGYEYNFYKECVEKLPKIGTYIKTKDGEGKVVSIDCIKEKITVELKKDEEVILKTYDVKDTYQ